MQVLNWSRLTASEQAQALARPSLRAKTDLTARVGEIVAKVRRDGDKALVALTREIDNVEITTVELPQDEWAAPIATLTAKQRAAIDTAAANITRFHDAQRPSTIDIETMPGVRCERLTRAIASVGLYVPAGTAPLPSTALMLGIPAKLAGCATRVLCSPPTAEGGVDAAVLYAAQIAGVERVFRIGGAQAVAAMAYGTETVPRVDKIFGPGNPWVTEAKSQVDQDPNGAARDFPAGPSEVLVIADDSAHPKFVATDLLSQAEHGPDSQVLLLTTVPTLAAQVVAEINELTEILPRRQIIAAALEHSRIIIVDSLNEAIEIANSYAPEHLLLQVESPRALLERVTAAGSVFLGPWAPESIGDYCSGTNHVLPTYGYARRFSSLGLADFMRSMTVQELTPEGIKTLGPVAETLARLERLDAHALAVSARLEWLTAENSA